MRGDWEVKSTAASPVVAFRQAAAESCEIAILQRQNGVACDKILVPFVGGQGQLLQFGVVVMLEPCCPRIITVSKILDLADKSERFLAARYVFNIINILHVQCVYGEKVPITKLSIDTTRYYMKKIDTVKDYFVFPLYLDRSLYHMFDALQLAYLHPNLKNHFVFPYGVRKESATALYLIFKCMKSLKYSVGIPESDVFQAKYFILLHQILQWMREAGVVHLDLFPSNIMWKATPPKIFIETENENEYTIDIQIIDFASIHRSSEPLAATAKSNLNGSRNGLIFLDGNGGSDVHLYDSTLVNLLELNKGNKLLQSKQKIETMDNEFRKLINAAAYRDSTKKPKFVETDRSTF